MTGESPKSERIGGLLTEEFVRNNRQRLVAVGRRAVDSLDAAEELVQEVFEKCLEAKAVFGGDRRFFDSYVFRVLQRTISDYYRAQSSPNDQLELYSESLVSRSLDPEESVIANEEFQRLLIEINKLPPAQQKVILLRMLEFNHLEISELLGIALTTSKSQMSRAATTIKKKWDDN